MSFKTKLDLLSDRARPIAPLSNVARKDRPWRQPALSTVVAVPRRSDAFVGVAGHLMAPFMPDVLLFERLVSDRGVAAERTAEGDV